MITKETYIINDTEVCFHFFILIKEQFIKNDITFSDTDEYTKDNNGNYCRTRVLIAEPEKIAWICTIFNIPF